jgi:EAL domain-containing protein (putative c-di-GMP-specific phosphodiesterase class I)
VKEKIMSLQQLVNHFNDRFAQEQGFNFRPFILQGNAVSGLFGKNRIESELTAVRHTNSLQTVTGYAAQTMMTHHFFSQQQFDTDNLLSSEPSEQNLSVDFIINFDRLCRTVHLLNALALIKRSHSFLVLEVDPRHIIGVKHAHGAYFEEIIIESGLQTKNIVISMTTSGIYEAHHEQLLKGLKNYRDCGYKIALNIGYLFSADRVLDLINKASPDYITVNAPNQSYATLDLNVTLFPLLNRLKELVNSVGGKSIMQGIDLADQALIAKKVGFDLVQGSYYQTESLQLTAVSSVSCLSNSFP